MLNTKYHWGWWTSHYFCRYLSQNKVDDKLRDHQKTTQQAKTKYFFDSVNLKLVLRKQHDDETDTGDIFSIAFLAEIQYIQT